MLISIVVSSDRLKLGRLSVDGFVAECYLKADSMRADGAGNPTRDPTLKFGDTPTGTYVATVGQVETPEYSYGASPVIHLRPIEGDGLVRARNEKLTPGQLGLAMHAGALDERGRLRPTLGCVRNYPEAQAELVERMLAWGGTATLTISECA